MLTKLAILGLVRSVRADLDTVADKARAGDVAGAQDELTLISTALAAALAPTRDWTP